MSSKENERPAPPEGGELLRVTSVDDVEQDSNDGKGNVVPVVALPPSTKDLDTAATEPELREHVEHTEQSSEGVKQTPLPAGEDQDGDSREDFASSIKEDDTAEGATVVNLPKLRNSDPEDIETTALSTIDEGSNECSSPGTLVADDDNNNDVEEWTLPALPDEDDEDLDDTASEESINTDLLRVKLQAGVLQIGTFEDDIAGTFPYNALAAYSNLVSEGLKQHGLDTFFRIKFDMTEDMSDPVFTAIFWWLTKTQIKPALDHPFSALFSMMTELHTKIEEAGPDGIVSAALPMRPAVTCDASILQIAKMYWSAKQLKLQRPLDWDKTLRSALLKKIRAIDTTSREPFRGSDFCYVWSVFRGSDDELVTEFLKKLVEARDRRTDPAELWPGLQRSDAGHGMVMGRGIIGNVALLEKHLDEVKASMPKKTWAESLGSAVGGGGAPESGGRGSGGKKRRGSGRGKKW